MAADDVRKLVYTSRQLNTLPDNPLTIFNFIVLCSVSQMDMVVEEVNRCYDNVDRAYWSQPSTSLSGYSQLKCTRHALYMLFVRALSSFPPTANFKTKSHPPS